MKYVMIPILALVLAFPACEPANEDAVVGSTSDTRINNVTFSVDSTYLDGAAPRLIARGRARNGGSANITTPWYVEGQFYADQTSTLKLGGSYTQIGVPLSGGQEAVWTITFSSGNVDVRNYPNFRIGDLRAIYK